MEQRKCYSELLFPCLLLLCFTGSAKAYKNYTVGDSLGWYDNTEKPTVNYQKWASGKVFSLGDFLIFNTNTNHSVVQTYNATTYELCDYDDALDNDTTQWSTSNPSNTDTQPVTVAVPLMKEGATYFFSGDYDGDQCKSGLHFQINVTHGQGLPKSLQSPEEESPSPASPVAGDDDSAPDTIIPSNFNKPKEEGDDMKTDDGDSHKSGSVSMSMHVTLHRNLYGCFVLLGLVFLF
ncbi:hypothetical protein L6164_031322 [Bauhinia variegata]|uniref:Uncharacterized protein n=1 Tax=Bauhinia variegata TaxID=167791 RepID=A0ACB9LF41_BAUVA|nr:hypothetical protein L6164_031322 [Bauhinia variegata]